MTIQNKLVHHKPPFWGLTGLAFIALGQAFSYGPWFHVPLPLGLKILTSWIVPLWVFALGWFIAGAAILVEAIRGRPGWAALGGIVFMTMIWGTFYEIGWAVSVLEHLVPPNRNYVSGILYLGLGLYIWGNVPQEDDVTEDGPFVVTNVTVELEHDTGADT